MNEEEKKSKKLWQKLLAPYLLMVINEETFEERAQIRTSKVKIIIVSIFLLTLLLKLSYTMKNNIYRDFQVKLVNCKQLF